MSRIETGPAVVGDDWPGIFIRGDNAFAHAMALALVVERLQPLKHELAVPLAQVDGLRQLLLSCDARTCKNPQRLRFEEAQAAGPVAWGYQHPSGGWIVLHSERAAEEAAAGLGAEVVPLYARG